MLLLPRVKGVITPWIRSTYRVKIQDTLISLSTGLFFSPTFIVDVWPDVTEVRFFASLMLSRE